MAERNTIVFASETFGFGPAGNMLAIAQDLQHLRDSGYNFLGVGQSALEELTTGTALFDHIAPNGTDEDRLAIMENADKFAAVFSVGERTLSLLARNAGVPHTWNYDMLLPLWTPSNVANIADQRRTFESIKPNDPQSVLAFANGLARSGPAYDLELSMVYSSTRSWFLEEPGVEGIIDELCNAGALDPEKATTVGAVIPSGLRGVEKAKDLFINLGGASYPILTKEQHETYAHFTMSVLASALEQMDAPPSATIAVNHRYHDLDSARRLEKFAPLEEPYPPRIHTENIAGHLVYVAPPSKISVYDSAALGVPFFKLPPKHAEQDWVDKQFRGIEDKVGYRIPSATLRHLTGYTPPPGSEIEMAHALNDEYKRMAEADIAAELGAAVSQQIQELLRCPEKHAKGVVAVCLERVSNFSGAETITADIDHLLRT